MPVVRTRWKRRCRVCELIHRHDYVLRRTAKGRTGVNLNLELVSNDPIHCPLQVWQTCGGPASCVHWRSQRRYTGSGKDTRIDNKVEQGTWRCPVFEGIT